MPNYEYRCEQGHRFDAITSFANSDNPKDCPVCGHASWRRFTPTTAEAVLLGTGWAKKDRQWEQANRDSA